MEVSVKNRLIEYARVFTGVTPDSSEVAAFTDGNFTF